MLKIRPESPFNFELSAMIFSTGDSEIQKYENGNYWQVIDVNNQLILIKVHSVGTVEKPELCVNVMPDKHLNDDDIEFIKDKVISIFNLNFNLVDFYDDMKNDAVMSHLTHKLRGLKSPTTPTFFEAIVSSIIEQQISLKAARSIETRMIKKFGKKLLLEGDVYYEFPTPSILSKLGKEDLRMVGLSFRKAEYVIGLSKCVDEDKFDLNKFKTKSAPDIIEELLKIRGIGVWTAELAVIRGLHMFVALPADDIGLRRVVSHFYKNGEPISADELRIIARKWGKWSGLVAFYLIIADLMSVQI